jgi:tRNA pseudouridine55 synthase
MFGFLNVYKPKGKTSHDVVAYLRRVTKIKQIGHTGTLDPFAEGVLPVCIGKATRLIEYLSDDKAYKGIVQLGSSTTTYDTEGDIVKSSDKTVSADKIENALNNFKGEIMQTPPVYSAIKVNGRKLYEYARRGEEVNVEPRKVSINKIVLLNYDSDLRQAELLIECSKGTYIRSIANDLGEMLGTYGHLIKLVRIKAGSFEIDSSLSLDTLQTKEQVESNLIYPLERLSYPKYELSASDYERVSHGMNISSTKTFNDGIVMLIKNNMLVAVAKKTGDIINCNKVFI